jgi:energy-coupling factor transport system permease protein
VTGLVPVYRDTGSALHGVRAGVGAAFTLAPCVAALVTRHPLMVAAALGSVIAAGIAAGAGAELRRAARWAIPLALLVAAVNPLVSREGLTLLVQGPVVPLYGTLDVTLEAVVYGAIAGLRVLVIVLAFALYSATVDPDAVLRGLRKIAPRSALTAALATRMAPLLARDAERMQEAYALRADASGDHRLGARMRRAGAMTRALGAGALERAMDSAASLEVRGYGARVPARRGAADRIPWSRADRAFALAALSLTVLPVALRLSGGGWFDPYPTVAADGGVAVASVAVLLVVVALTPFALSARRRGGRAHAGVARA